MTTYSARLSDRRKRFALWFTVQGIDRVFKEVSTIDCSTILGETRPESTCIALGGVEEGEQTIDMIARCATGGSLRLTLLEPFGTTVLRDLFQTRKRKVARVSLGGLSASATSVNVDDTSFITSFPGTIYIGAETITVGAAATGPVRFTGCTRAKYDSRAQAQAAATDQGAAVYDVAPSWIGRRVYLYGSFLREDGTTTAALTDQIGTFIIESPGPRWAGDRTWEIQCGPLSDEFARRKLYVGLKEQRGGAMYLASSTDTDFTVEVEDATFFTPATSDYPSYALLTIPPNPDGPLPARFTRYMIGKVTAADAVSDPNTITITAVPGLVEPPVRRSEIANASPAAGGAGLAVESVRHIALLGGGGGVSTALLYGLLSVLGDGTNGSLDTLPGKARTGSAFNDDSWRFGAAIDQNDVDTAAFVAPIINNSWMYFLDEATTVADLLKEWCFATNTFWHTTPAGLLSAKVMSDVPTASSLTITDAMRAGDKPPEVFVDEEAVVPIIEVHADYSPLSRQFRFHDVTMDQELIQRYPTRDEILEVSLKGVGVQYSRSVTEWPQHFVRPDTMTEPQLAQMARAWQQADGRGRLVVKVTCKLQALSASLGDVVTIGFDASAPDYEGGSLNGRHARVIGRRPRYDDGAVDLTLQVMDTVFLFTPSAVFHSGPTTTSVANDTITLLTTAPSNSGTSPENDFPVGAVVRLWDVSAGTSQTLTVAAVLSGNRLQFTAGVSGTPEADRDWLTWSTLGVNDGLTSTSGYTEDDLAYMMPDTGSAASGDMRRWR